MKKIVLLMSLLLCILLVAGCNGEVELTVKDGEAANGFLWENNYSEITITGYEGTSNDIVIPAKINGKPVTLIAKDAFSGFSGMKSLKIPGSVKKIDRAFQNCTSLEKVELAEGLESMNEAFMYCESIEKIVIPSSVKEMASSFERCTALEEANIPKNVTNASRAFWHCTALKDVTIEEGADGLSGTFAGCTGLESIVIPKGVENLYGTFSNCTSLKTVSLPEGLKQLGRTFSGCKSLVKITIPDSVTIIGRDGSGVDDCFNNCISLETLNLPDGYKGYVTLPYLPKLKKVTMSEESMDKAIKEKDYFDEWVQYEYDNWPVIYMCAYYMGPGGGIVEVSSYPTKIEVNGKTVYIMPCDY